MTCRTVQRSSVAGLTHSSSFLTRLFLTTLMLTSVARKTLGGCEAMSACLCSVANTLRLASYAEAVLRAMGSPLRTAGRDVPVAGCGQPAADPPAEGLCGFSRLFLLVVGPSAVIADGAETSVTTTRGPSACH